MQFGKIIEINDLSNMSIDELIEAYKSGYILDTNKMSTITGNSEKIKSLSPSCAAANKSIGDTVMMSASPSHGIAPYTVKFYKDSTLLKTISGVTENQTVSYPYVTTTSDKGTRNFSVTATDSCKYGPVTSPADSCIVSVGTVSCIPKPGETCVPVIGPVKTSYLMYGGAAFLALMILK